MSSIQTVLIKGRIQCAKCLPISLLWKSVSSSTRTKSLPLRVANKGSCSTLSPIQRAKFILKFQIYPKLSNEKGRLCNLMKMECYATPWPLWRESRILFFFTELYYPENLPLSFVAGSCSLFSVFMRMNASCFINETAIMSVIKIVGSCN